MISRRRFLQSSLSLALLPLLPRAGLAQTSTLRIRPDWPTFRISPMFASLTRGIAAMKANKDSTSPNSWVYWANVHKSYCPHGKPYFLAWHRGYLLRMEARLRTASGDSSLVLPYWNYYADPQIPAEFLDVSSPLYRANRVGTDVSAALSMDAYADQLVNFQRGLTDAYEPVLESRPHNPVHNLIGGVMATISSSPLDPVFWVHHANIDRLWAAWVAAGNGRHMPDATDPYWSGSFNYGAALKTLARKKTITTTGLGYQYDNLAMPLPVYGYAAAPAVGAAQQVQGEARHPETGSLMLGEAGGIVLAERPVSLRVPLSATDRARVRSLLTQPAGSSPSATSPRAVRVVLDGVRLTARGKQGGYFYKVFVNLPTSGLAQPESTYLLGTLGPFEVDVARHMTMRGQGGGMSMDGPVQIVFPATEALRRIWPQPLDQLTVSFVRIDGRHPGVPGPVMTLDQVRVEVDR